MGVKKEVAIWAPTFVFGSAIAYGAQYLSGNAVAQKISESLPGVRAYFDTAMATAAVNIDHTIVTTANSLDDVTRVLAFGVCAGAILATVLTIEHKILPYFRKEGTEEASSLELPKIGPQPEIDRGLE